MTALCCLQTQIANSSRECTLCRISILLSQAHIRQHTGAGFLLLRPESEHRTLCKGKTERSSQEMKACGADPLQLGPLDSKLPSNATEKWHQSMHATSGNLRTTFQPCKPSASRRRGQSWYALGTPSCCFADDSAGFDPIDCFACLEPLSLPVPNSRWDPYLCSKLLMSSDDSHAGL